MSDEEIISCFQLVYNRLKSADAVADLGLPAAETFPSFEACCSKIIVWLVRVDYNYSLPDSRTTTCGGLNQVSEVVLFYYQNEANCYPQILAARMLHEATQALRTQIILQYNSSVLPGSMLKISNPEASQCQFRGRVFLEEDKFQAGYWMNHALIGGVWVALDRGGSLFDPRTEKITKVRDPEIPATSLQFAG